MLGGGASPCESGAGGENQARRECPLPGHADGRCTKSSRRDYPCPQAAAALQSALLVRPPALSHQEHGTRVRSTFREHCSGDGNGEHFRSRKIHPKYHSSFPDPRSSIHRPGIGDYAPALWREANPLDLLPCNFESLTCGPGRAIARHPLPANLNRRYICRTEKP